MLCKEGKTDQKHYDVADERTYMWGQEKFKSDNLKKKRSQEK